MLKQAAFATVLGVSVLVGGHARAASNVIYPAIMCRPWITAFNGDEDLQASNGCLVFAASVNQVGSSWPILMCPVPDHSPNDTTAFSALRMTVIDRSDTGDVSCTVTAANSSGTMEISLNMHTTGFNSARQSFTFPAMSGFASGQNFIECNMPGVGPIGSSAVCAYRVQEP